MKVIQRIPSPILLTVSLALLGFACVGPPKNPMTVKQVEKKVRNGVPLGSNRLEVEAWLKSQGIEYGYHDDPKSDSSVNDAGLEPDTLSGVIQGIIRDTDRSLMVEGSICLYFFLDKEGRTVKQGVKWVGTGP
jgi:hypothetical protein